VGFDASRITPGEVRGPGGAASDILSGFDVDTLIDRWQNQPISALGDATLIAGIGKKIASKTGKVVASSADKKAVRSAIERNADNLDQMGRDITDRARARAVSGKFETKFEKLLKHSKVIKGDRATKMPPMTNKMLDSPDWFRRRSVELSDDLIKIKKSENSKLTAIIKQAEDIPIKEGDLLVKSFRNFSDKKLGGLDAKSVFYEFFSTTDEFIPLIGSKKVDKFTKDINKRIKAETLTVGSMKKILDEIDDEIDWITPKRKKGNEGLKALRKSMRQELGATLPSYDVAASRVHDRLTTLGFIEKKISGPKRIKGYKERLAKDILKSEDFTEEVIGTLDSLAKQARSSEAAQSLGTLEALSGWRAWNEFHSQNQKFISSFLSIPVGPGTRTSLSTLPGVEFGRKFTARRRLSPVTQAVGGVAAPVAGAVGRGVTAPIRRPGATSIAESLRTSLEDVER